MDKAPGKVYLSTIF